MKSKLKKLLRPFLFTVGGALAGLGYYYVVGCSTGSCAITSNPIITMIYMGVIGLLLSGLIVVFFGFNFLGVFKLNLFRGGGQQAKRALRLVVLPTVFLCLKR